MKLATAACSTWIALIGKFFFYILLQIKIELTFDIATGGLLRARGEDKLMKEEFGESWKAWARSVPYLLVPYVY